MNSPELESFLARLYVDDAARAKFLQAPSEEAARAGLSNDQCVALANIDRVGLEMAARSFARKRAVKARHLDPVLAYGKIAGEYSSICDRRRAYLDAIERLVISEIPRGSQSLLDVGAGDGTRAMRIVKGSGVERFVLLEPSPEMRSQWPAGVRGWPIRAEELCSKNESFDVITCLWNVLGHIFPAGSRGEVIRQCARLLAPEGRMFIDVSHRYNAAHYGIVPTALRIVGDYVRPRVSNGDVTVRWHVGGTTCSTAGHVFTYGEFGRMIDSAGLAIEKTSVVSYSTGEIQRSRFAGNPLYVLRRKASTT